MIGSVINFVKLPWLLILIWAVMRFSLGVFFNVPYAPRGNAMFSLVGLTIISSIYFGALSNKVGGFDWKGTVLTGVFIALFAQVLIFLLSILSLAAGLENSYFLHWDALNLTDGQSITMGSLLSLRLVGIIVNSILGGIAASLGRALAGFAPAAKA
ncbi:MAG: hypothetical protein H6696_02105 [Deferribacteres bacterium]|nr:hypothetical protein [candidate division KSB1 bacterium]MCB9500706.1 hypothetical protein [Deferribacteres bacterium]